MLGHNFGVLLAEVVEELRRALDVGEEKGDGAAWKFGHFRKVTTEISQAVTRFGRDTLQSIVEEDPP